MLSKSTHIVGQQLACDMPIVVTSFSKFVGGIKRTCIQIASDDIWVVRQCVPTCQFKLLALLIIDKRRNYSRKTQTSQWFIGQRTFTRQLCTMRYRTTTILQQSIGIGTTFSRGDTTITPHCWINSWHQTHCAEWIINLITALGMTNAHIQGCTQFLIDIKIVVSTEHITLETTTIVKTIHLIISQGCNRFHRLVSTRHCQRVSHTRCTAVQYQTLPIGYRIIIGIRLIVFHPILSLVCSIYLKKST